MSEAEHQALDPNDLRDLTRRIRDFSDARDWRQFHTPKNLVIALAVEVAELAEHFQWLSPAEAETLARDGEARGELVSELADIAIYLLRMADVLGIEIGPAVLKKVERNEARYPAHLVRGRANLPHDSGADGQDGHGG